MTKHIATIKITLKEKDATDGILERISDLASEYGAEDDGSNLVYTLKNENLDELREDVVAFGKALREFLRVIKIIPAPLNIKYREETA
jgi:Asp-tRNA(Asn)/Glu-tRNA(Gln) amidotransferase C subunit